MTENSITPITFEQWLNGFREDDACPVCCGCGYFSDPLQTEGLTEYEACDCCLDGVISDVEAFRNVAMNDRRYLAHHAYRITVLKDVCRFIQNLFE